MVLDPLSVDSTAPAEVQTSAAVPGAPGPTDPHYDPVKVAEGPDPWIALNSEEQIERLRVVVQRQDKQLAELRYCVGELLRHQHGADGAMVVPLRIGNERRDDRQPDPAKAWL